MADESLEAVLSVFTNLGQLDDLIRKLLEVDRLISRVDGRNINIDVNDRELDALLAKMGAAGIGNIGVPGGKGGGADTGSATRKVTESMNNVAESASKAASSFDITNLRMSDLHNLLARLVPLILVLIGSIPALVGAFVGLAAAAVAATAALAGLVGFAGLGLAIQRGGIDNIGEGFQDMLREVRGDFLDAFAPLAERLAPLMEDALDGLDMLFQAIADRGDVLVTFGNAARDLGDFILDTLPGVIAVIGRIATAFAPVFEHFANLIGGANFGEGFMSFMADVLPAFTDFVQLVILLLPHILGLSIGFLQITNAVLAFFNVLFDILTIGGMFNEFVGAAIAGLLAMITVLSILNSNLFAMAAAAFPTTISGFIGMIASMKAYVVSALSAITVTNILRAAVIGLATAIALTGIGALLVGVGAVASKFLNLGGNIRSATSELRNFQSVSNRVSGTNPYGNVPVPERGSLSGGGFNQVNVTVEGDADKDTVAQETKNANFRMSTTGSTIQ